MPLIYEFVLNIALNISLNYRLNYIPLFLRVRASMYDCICR